MENQERSLPFTRKMFGDDAMGLTFANSKCRTERCKIRCSFNCAVQTRINRVTNSITQNDLNEEKGQRVAEFMTRVHADNSAAVNYLQRVKHGINV
ncbi:hypothetical protein F8M41_018830 [Gigaspora margarita]|uniref:Uncharacterized protein n=1 Tax=Gigaspora margarita TaxID=4874 RepID=A0A8H4AKX2_GIGMA|nr:hypothetical protein F8M41_018830 [Gigaspora margarita]